MSFYTSLTGLKAAQTELSTISNNVANVDTTGFRKSRAEFGDIIASSQNQAQQTVIGQGTQLKSVEQQFTQGGFKTTDRALDLAISGDGFFTTKSASGAVSFTRNGNFSVDTNRAVVDSNGSRVQVFPVDLSGNPTATGLGAAQDLVVPLTSGQPKATSKIDTVVNLPQGAPVPADSAIFSSTNPYAFDRTDPNTYNYASNTTVYDAAGNPLTATIYFTRTQAASTADPTSKWEARLFIGDTEASADPSAATQPAPIKMSFDSAGAMTRPTAATTFNAVLPSGATAPIAVAVDFGSHTNQASTLFSVSAASQDGYAAGQLNGVTVGTDGVVTASFSNSTSQALGKLVMAKFSNPEGLRQIGNARWTATGLSGAAIVGGADDNGFGSIKSGSLENSNVDLTDELVNLIAAQRNFQANAKAIETANTITSTIVNIRS